MRVEWRDIRRRSAAALALLTCCAALAPAGDAGESGDTFVAGVYALDGTVLYHRAWSDREAPGYYMRIVDGRHREARDVPRRSSVYSIGRDRRGRIVAVVGQFVREGVTRWFLYDVERDEARRLRVRRPPGCDLGSAAVWRRGIAFQVRCGRDDVRVYARVGGRLRRIRGFDGNPGPHLVLRGKSLTADGLGGERRRVWRLLDRGRNCPAVVADVDEEDGGVRAGMGARKLVWVETLFDRVSLYETALGGRCQRPGRRRLTSLDLPAFTAVAIDGRVVYYADESGIHRRRLP